MDLKLTLPRHWLFASLTHNCRGDNPKAFGFKPNSPPAPLWVTELYHPGTDTTVAAGGNTAEESMQRVIVEVRRREVSGVTWGKIMVGGGNEAPHVVELKASNPMRFRDFPDYDNAN